MINFWKLYKKTAPFNQISSEIRKRAAQSLTAYDWHSSKDASQHVCIYGTIKNRVHILPLIFKLISVYFSWICHKKRFRCNLFQVASKVLNKHVSSQHFRCSCFDLYLLQIVWEISQLSLEISDVMICLLQRRTISERLSTMFAIHNRENVKSPRCFSSMTMVYGVFTSGKSIH